MVIRCTKFLSVLLLVFTACGAPLGVVDSGVPLDAGVDDAGTIPITDAGLADAGSTDAGPVDAGSAAALDAGTADGGGFDAGLPPPDGGRPCDANPGRCDPLTVCDDSSGVAVCGPCPAGYSGDGVSGCSNIDECATDAGTLCPLRQCLDTVGSFQCGTCVAGYRPNPDGGVDCVDVNECPSGCHPLTTCSNTIGSFSCTTCPGPYLGNGKSGCVLPPPTLRVRGLTDGGVRALSLCTTIGAGLPKPYDDVIIDDFGIESGWARYELSLSTDAGPNARIVVTDIASGTWVTQTNTHFVGRGMIFDIAIMLHTTNVISPLTGSGVLTLRYCRESIAGPCVELRDALQFDTGTSVVSSRCDEPPVLEAGSDLGPSNADDWTSDFTPTLAVTTAASSVTWFRNGVLLGTSTPTAGVATFTDQGAADGGQTGYSVRHGATGLPSAQRFVILSNSPAPSP